MSSALKKITARARQLRKKSPKMLWKSAVKKAGQEYRAGKLGATKMIEKGESRNTRATRVYQVKRSKRGTYQGAKRVAGTAVSRAEIIRYYKDRLAGLLLSRELAKKVTDRRRFTKQIAEVRALLKKL